MAGDEALERVLEALGKVILPQALALIQPNLAHAQWEHRRAALAIIMCAADAAAKALRPELDAAASALVQGLSDMHPRVKIQAMRGIATMSDCYPGEFQKRSHSQVRGAELPATLHQQQPWQWWHFPPAHLPL